MDKQRPKYTWVRVGENFAVVRPANRLVGDNETDEFTAILKQLNDQRLKFVVVDLGAIDWVNSTGLRALREACDEFARRDAHVLLARVAKRIHNLFIVTRLSLTFDTFGSIEDAILAGSSELSTPA